MVSVLSFCPLVSPNYPIFCASAAFMLQCLHIFAPNSSVHLRLVPTRYNEDSEHAQVAKNNQHVLTTKPQLTTQRPFYHVTQIIVRLVVTLWEARADCL